MSNPAYLWLTDENNSPIVGGSLVSGRIGAIELKSLTHNIRIPVDGNTGRLTGTRVHSPIIFQKEFDRVTPFLYKTLSEGITLRSATFKLYTILESGLESDYFNVILGNVKIVSITPNLFQGGVTGTHIETVEVRYESIEWKYCNGNIIYKNSWNERITA